MGSKIAYSIIFLPIILFIGVITSYEDFKESKIKNKWILVGLIYSFMVYLLFWILPKGGLLGSYLLCNFDKWCVNLLVSMVVAYLLWHFKMWGTGDAKLFICYAALIPMGQYSRVYFNYYFASFLLLSAIFIPASVFLITESFVYFVRRFNFKNFMERSLEFVQKWRIKFNFAEAGKVFFGFFLFFLFSKMLRGWLCNIFNSRILVDQSIPMLISLILFKQLSKIFEKNIKFIIFAFIIFIVYIMFGRAYSWQQFTLEIRSLLGNTMSVMVLFPIFSKIVELHAERTVKKTVPFAVWMLLGVLITWFS